jgi:hypothetical protein
MLAAKVVVCKPADPEAKCLIERCHDYLERSFLPGCSFHLTERLQRSATAVDLGREHPPTPAVGMRTDRSDQR